MSSGTQDMDYRRSPQGAQADRCVDAWLHRALTEQYRQVVDEPLPDSLLQLLKPN